MRSVMAKNVRDADDHSLKAMHDQAYHFLQPVDVIFDWAARYIAAV